MQTAALQVPNTPRIGRFLFSVLPDRNLAVIFTVSHKRSGCNVAAQRTRIHVARSRYTIQGRRHCRIELGRAPHSFYLHLGFSASTNREAVPIVGPMESAPDEWNLHSGCGHSFLSGLWPSRLSNTLRAAGKTGPYVGLEARWGYGTMCCNSDGATGHPGQQPGHL